MVTKVETDISRFHRSYFITSCGCCIWLRATTVKGSRGHAYGQFWIGSRTDKTRRVAIATRWIWEHLHGKIPSGNIVCHTCDIPECVNPEHLWLGTVKENARDMVEKGRAPDGVTRLDGTKKVNPSGEKHPRWIDGKSIKHRNPLSLN